ncbi:MAG TPA: HAD-IC family P-type ATPase, partial [Pyrinomonadaceae bacterium]|nr:HAD-IC family P-type ATPase [Pyrinomonadaceae bacterium]
MEIKQKELKTKINFGGSTDSNTEENKIILGDFLDAPHSHQPNIIIQALGVDLESGLSSSEATDRLKLYGKNELNQTLGLSWWKILLGQFSSIIVWLLGVAAIISWLTDGWLEAVAILVVLALNGLIGFAIEWRAGRALDVLRRETKTTAKVRRDGYERKIEAWELVVGDIISLTAGDKVPADARLIEAVNLRVDESSFTGESLPVEKSIESVDYNSILAERCSMLYLGTMIVGGRAIAIVTATGSYTELGRIGLLIDKIETGQTILEQRLDSLGKLLVYIVIGIALVVLLSGILRGDNPLLMFEVAVSLAVAAVPEGLPAMTTLILAMGVLRMARRHAIVRRLSAVETLGSTTVICTDKTGTLTENKMTVQEYRLSNQQIITLSANKANGISDLEATLIKEPNFLRLARVNLLCNEAAFNLSNCKELTLGDPTETALIIGIQKLGFDVCNEKSNYQILKEIPFDSVTGRMMTVVQNNKSNKCFATMKGAPAVVLEACSNFIGENDKILALDEDTRKKFLKINEEMATRALRVLAFADQEL